MIKRIVKLTFRPEDINRFIEIFAQTREKIENVDGIESLELVKDIHHENVYMTISKWKSEEALENYRKSELFQITWMEIRNLFSEKAEAWSLRETPSE